MDSLRYILFENPWPPVIILGLAEIVAAGVWHRRRTKGWLMAALVLPLAAGALIVAATLVETDREQIDAILNRTAERMAANQVDEAAECLDANCVCITPLGVPLPRAALVAGGKKALGTYPVRKITVSDVETTFAGRNATTRAQTRVFLPAARSLGREFLDISWDLQWAKRPEGWRIIRVEVTKPKDLMSSFLQP